MVNEENAKASALIYCRTYHKDYNANFIVRPNDFSDTDIAEVGEYVLAAVSYCDMIDRERWIVFRNRRYLIFGMAGILRCIMENDSEDQRFMCDEYGRDIKCFLGYVYRIPEKSAGTIPDVCINDFVGIFKKYVAKTEIWESFDNINMNIDYELEVPQKEYQGSRGMPSREAVSEKEEDRRLFERALASVLMDGENVNLCTNVYNVEMVKETRFTHITADKNVIERYQRAYTDNSGKKDEETDKTMEEKEDIHEEYGEENIKKKRNRCR